MTIAACYVTPEGVVLGADSTTSMFGNDSSFHYFNNNQKLFEIGEDSTLGLLTWGLGSLGAISYRTLLAELADQLKTTPAKSVEEVTSKWIDHFWKAYNLHLKPILDQLDTLRKKSPYNPVTKKAGPAIRTELEEAQLVKLESNLIVGFCIGGYVKANRKPTAFHVIFQPLEKKPAPVEVQQYNFWGAPNMIHRLIHGWDSGIKTAILSSGKWSGKEADLNSLLSNFTLGHPMLPIRDAIDFVHACIYSTIKAMKFSSFNQICGGPVELAVITSDRKFRWVWHKNWDAAINEGGHR